MYLFPDARYICYYSLLILEIRQIS